ncbi:hypothetical protein [Amycolatopsis sp. NPDC057786]|uniref:hypothetical protein n=1 Tax=Amycolatopsis sp. NPDC057786 TaxID=3346250 RepID=UPI00366DA784
MTTIQIVAWSCWGGFVALVVLVSVFQMRKLKHREKGMQAWPVRLHGRVLPRVVLLSTDARRL